MDRPENNERRGSSFPSVLISHYLDRGGASSSDPRLPVLQATRRDRAGTAIVVPGKTRIYRAGMKEKKKEEGTGAEEEADGERKRGGKEGREKGEAEELLV